MLRQLVFGHNTIVSLCPLRAYDCGVWASDISIPIICSVPTQPTHQHLGEWVVYVLITVCVWGCVSVSM